MTTQQICDDVLAEKYLKNSESNELQLFERVARGIASVEKTPEAIDFWRQKFYENMTLGAFGAGRIMSASGTDIAATLINCFVQPVGDCIDGFDDNGLPGIYKALTMAAETMRRGGGVGYNFSAIRPKGAMVKSTHSIASGPCSYMNIFDKSCETVESAGSRRGAQMGILNDSHPDILEFIEAKRTKGRWNNFNVSVAVSDAFLYAVEADSDWELIHCAIPNKAAFPESYVRQDGAWVYRVVKARELMGVIMKSAYDFAEPGVVFVDKVNCKNNLRYVEKIEATNPCVTKETWVMTSTGAAQVKDLIGKTFLALVDGCPHTTESEGFFKTGHKPVLTLKTDEGFELHLTHDHLVRQAVGMSRNSVNFQWKPAGELKQGDKVVLNNHRKFCEWIGDGTKDEGYLLGLLIGDGTMRAKSAVICVWGMQEQSDDSVDRSYCYEGAKSVIAAAEAAAFKLNHRSDFAGFQKSIVGRGESRMVSAAVFKLALKYGLSQKFKTITSKMEAGSSEFSAGLLRGLFDADGSVQGTQEKGVSVRLSQSDLTVLSAVQRMLLRFGVVSKIYTGRRPAQNRELPDGRGGKALYATKENHELVISCDNLVYFFDRVGFADTVKSDRLKRAIGDFKREMNRERFVATVKSVSESGTEDVFDVTVSGCHAFDANGLYVHNCGEQPLPAYGCCDLGPIDLTRFVSRPTFDVKTAEFAILDFAKAVKIQVRFLDNVLDATMWPLVEQRNEAAAKRRIGVGFTGLGNALTMLGVNYNSDTGRSTAALITEAMAVSAYEASVDLAIERGAFPLFDAEEYLKEGTFASTLPSKLKDRIREHGIRNSHLLSIAPTGTVSLAFADNASNGIEPAFSLAYMRKKRMADGTSKSYPVLDHAFRVFLDTLEASKAKALQEAVCAYKTSFEFDGEVLKVKDVLPRSFVTALEISASDHVAMLTAVQPLIDSAISKTVNIPEDYPFDDFKDLYMQAWKAGLKGLAVYRPNSTLGSVLSVGTPVKEELKPQVVPDFVAEIPDVDPMTVVIESRNDDCLESMTKRIRFFAEGGDRSYYVTVSMDKVEGRVDGKVMSIDRPVEVFVTGGQGQIPQEWVASFARQMSLLARCGLLAKALKDSRQVRSDRGRIRFGDYEKADGSKAPRFHDSEVAVIAYAIQQMLLKRGMFDMEGNQIPSRVLAKRSTMLVLPVLEFPQPAPLQDKAEAQPAFDMKQGKNCHECGADAVIKKDGCEFCTNCGAVGSCG